MISSRAPTTRLSLAETHPDGYLDNKMFHKKIWCHTLSRIVIVEGKTRREMPYSEVFGNMMAVLERERSMGFALGLRAYEAIVGFLQDDGRFRTADNHDWVVVGSDQARTASVARR